jgi:hypothetical protein
LIVDQEYASSSLVISAKPASVAQRPMQFALNQRIAGREPDRGTSFLIGCGKAWLIRVIWDHEIVSSNLTTRTIWGRMYRGGD